ncbi:hypothetical protein [Streptomyces sp. NPDC087300]|uniref:hypothetical protein n=1 Tax=Streptomyces sp. NPDC087300 TaxID=3365780 RepID=UPI00381284FA
MGPGGLGGTGDLGATRGTGGTRGTGVPPATNSPRLPGRCVAGGLAGNGERTGNVSLMTLAPHLYARGVHAARLAHVPTASVRAALAAVNRTEATA